MYQTRNLMPTARQGEANLLLPLLVIAGILGIGVISILYVASDAANPFSEMYLLPWVGLLGVILAIPNLYLYRKKQFNLFNPLIFATWSYFFPAFFLGGLFLASGLSQPFFLTLVDDERNNLPLTLVYVALGFAGLSVGFLITSGRNLGTKIGKQLPVFDWQPDNLLLPGVLLLCVGFGNSIIAFGYGLLGYQKVDTIGAYDGLLFLLTLFWLEGSFILWTCIFRTKKLNINHFWVITLLLVSMLTKAVFQGNRGSLISYFFLVACAFILSVPRITFKHRLYGGVLLFTALIVGMIYGTTFRSIKQSEEKVSFERYTESVSQTFDKLSDQDYAASLGEGFGALFERIEAVSSVAVLVSNYEKFEPYEESYDLKNNIRDDTLYSFIPRPLWKDKPVGSDPRKFADLYFNYSENSFTITPMGDLLRNFGAWGVFLGMLLLGFVLRLIYAGLIENQEFSYWRTALYYVLLTSISYEGFYGTIMPYLIKYGLIAVIGILFIRIFQPKQNKLTTARG